MILLPLEPPIDIGRDEAAEEARRELAKGAYDRTGESLFARAIDAVLQWIADLFDEVAIRAPGGNWGALIIVGLIGLIMVVVFWRAGVLRTTKSAAGAVFDSERVRTAKQYRAEAEQAAAAGEYAAAVRDRFRACAAELAERTIIDDRAGRTAHEVAQDAIAALPALREPLGPAAQVFNEVVYGNRPAGPQQYAVVTAADEAARTVSTRSLVVSGR
ncbi:MAG: DUF4129 domain-containing protein [Kribbellaceae bacterium]